MSGAMAGRSAGGAADNKGRIEATKVKRYRPGQVPDWMKTEDNEDAQIEMQFQRRAEVVKKLEPHHPVQTGIAAPVIVKKSEDPRLARLAAAPRPQGRRHREEDSRSSHGSSDDDGGGDGDERETEYQKGQTHSVLVGRRHPPTRSSSSSEGEDEDEDDDIASRRAALKSRLQVESNGRENPSPPSPPRDHRIAELKQEEEEEEEESSDEYETESEEDEDSVIGHHKPLAKPIFVPKSARQTILERQALEDQASLEAERQRQRLEQRKEETKEIVAARLAEEAAQEAAAAAGPKGAAEIITDDEALDEEEEYLAWRLRELNRIARDREEREQEAREAAEKERWKAMTEEERLAFLEEERRREGLRNRESEKPKKKYNFLQKYYHRGAFFQTEAEWKGEDAPLADIAVVRDFSAPTGEDVFDKSALPQVMQVKNFGKRGRSKWTHLKGEDTTDFNVPWAQNPDLKKKVEQRLAGTQQVFTKPKNTKT